MRATCTAYLLLDLITITTFLEVYVEIMTLLIMHFSPASSYFLHHSSKCLPRHTVLGLSGFVVC